MSLIQHVTRTLIWDDDYSGVRGNCVPSYCPIPAEQRKFAVQTVFCFLKDVIPHDSWFIGGSAARLGTIPFNDIDVFFADEEKAKEAIDALKHKTPPESLHDDIFASQKPITYAVNHAKENTPVLVTNMYQNSFMSMNASIKIANVSDPVTVQFITKNTGNYKDIFSRVDLNVCKIGILPNGRKVSDPKAMSDIKVSRLQHETMLRVVKYASRLYRKPFVANAYIRAAKDAIDSFIEDDSPSPDSQQFYQFQSHIPDNNVILTNELLKRQISQVFTPDSPVNRYFREQALKRAPELLL
ncbi:hypothetical protein AD45P3_00525 [Alteromonas phage vB_AmaP_AD45-P3]|nr:hypothetical protein AD45P3_00525 [Alteromonas phage vB_AmaP_AD45-P3]